MAAETTQTTDAPLTYHMDLSQVRQDLARQQRMQPNISGMERIASGVLGGAMSMFGFSRRSIAGVVLGAIGIALLERCMTGRCNISERLGRGISQGSQNE